MHIFCTVCLVFTAKNVVLSFVLMLGQTLHKTGSFSICKSRRYGETKQKRRRLFMRARIYFQFNRNLGWSILEGDNLNSVNSGLLESISY